MSKIIVLTGATGFVGKKLTLELLKLGYDLRILTRNKNRAQKILKLPVSFHEKPEPELFENCHALIHLAGEPIGERRWSEEVKKRIISSRVNFTHEIIHALKQAKNPPQILIGASAIGIYGNRGDELLSEKSSYETDFLAEVCKRWEESYSDFTGRVVLLRTGVVLGHSGAMEKMLPPFRLFAGGKISSGKQWMSWIHIEDLVRMYIWALENQVSGVFNAVAPEAVTNSSFTRELSRALSRPALFPLPAFVLKIIFGEMSTILLGSQRVSSKAVQDAGFRFNYSSLVEAFTDLLKPLNLSGAYLFEEYHWIPNPPEKVFPFFSEASNLETITPPWLNFHVVKMSTAGISKGTLIDYKLRIKGIPVRWRTLISRWEYGKAFVDEQIKGPYQTWHHTHEFLKLQNGTLMKDRVVYRLPFGPLGDLVKLIMVEKDIRMIFNYRSGIIAKKYSKF